LFRDVDGLGHGVSSDEVGSWFGYRFNLVRFDAEPDQWRRIAWKCPTSLVQRGSIVEVCSTLHLACSSLSPRHFGDFIRRQRSLKDQRVADQATIIGIVKVEDLRAEDQRRGKCNAFSSKPNLPPILGPFLGYSPHGQRRFQETLTTQMLLVSFEPFGIAFQPLAMRS